MVSLPEALTGASAGRQRLPREVMEEHQRDRVIVAAIEVFAKRGYPATTVDHLVEASQTGVGSFYALFEGKQGCMLRAFDRVVADVRLRVEAAVPGNASWPQQVCAALRELLAFAGAEPRAARVVLVEIQTAGSEALERYNGMIEELVGRLRRGREEAPEAADLMPALEEATVTGIAWLLHQRLVSGEAAGIPELFPELAEMVLEPYLGKERAQAAIEASAASPATG